MVAVIRMELRKHPYSSGVKTMIAELLTSLNKRFQFVIGEKQLMMATLLNPRFKDRFIPSDVCERVYEWLAEEVMSRNEDQNKIPPKRVAVDVQQLPQSSVGRLWSLTSTVDAPVSDSVVANRVTVMQMVHLYVAELTIDRMSDPLKWWAENGRQDVAPIAR